MSKIVDVERSEPIGRYAHGTTFDKGDFINRKREYWARTEDGKDVELEDAKIRMVLGVSRILWKVVRPLLIGRDAEEFRK